jgi:DME family drug/metabolite transporter
MDYSTGSRMQTVVRGRVAIPAIGAAAALWAIAGVVASSLFDAGVRPLDLAGVRALATAVGLAALPASWRRGDDARAVQVVLLGVALALVTASYYLAIARLPVAIGIVLQYMGPVLVFVWTALVFRRRPTRPVTGALLGSTTGVVLVTGVLSGDLGGLDAGGIVMGLGAAVSFAAYTILSERVRQSYEPQAALFRAFSVTAALWLVILVPSAKPLPAWDPRWLVPVAFVAVGGTLVPFLAYVWAVAYVRAERAAIAATLEPVLAAVVAWVWIGQALTASQMLGGALVIGSVAALQLFGSRSTSSPR